MAFFNVYYSGRKVGFATDDSRVSHLQWLASCGGVPMIDAQLHYNILNYANTPEGQAFERGWRRLMFFLLICALILAFCLLTLALWCSPLFLRTLHADTVLHRYRRNGILSTTVFALLATISYLCGWWGFTEICVTVLLFNFIAVLFSLVQGYISHLFSEHTSAAGQGWYALATLLIGRRPPNLPLGIIQDCFFWAVTTCVFGFVAPSDSLLTTAECSALLSALLLAPFYIATWIVGARLNRAQSANS